MSPADPVCRNDRAIQRGSRPFERLVESHAKLERSAAELERATARLDRSLDDLREQIGANTQATLKLIDRLGPPPG